MSDLFSDQKKFMQACGQTTDRFNFGQYTLYKTLIQEEVKELADAKEPVEELDALIDILVVTVGALHSMGADADGAWKEVMRSNFDKVDPRSGRVNKREDGKVLKPAGWEPPRLKPYLPKEM